MKRRLGLAFSFLASLLLFAPSCTPSDSLSEKLPLILEKANSDRLLSFYFGSYMNEAGTSPFDCYGSENSCGADPVHRLPFR